MTRKLVYERGQINAVLEKTLTEIGPEKFSTMGIVELEALIRSRHPNQRLPGRTIFREIMHEFRKARWPDTAPKPKPRR